MNFHLGSGVFVVRINKTKEHFIKKKYEWLENDKDLYTMEFADETKENGYVSFVKNAHVYMNSPISIEVKKQKEAVHFMLQDNYMIFSCINVSYVAKWKRFLEEMDISFDIVKHPFNEKVVDYRNQILLVMNDILNVEEILSFEMDKLFGSKMVYRDKGAIHILQFHTNGLVKFEMLNNEENVMKIIHFVVSFDKRISELIK